MMTDRMEVAMSSIVGDLDTTYLGRYRYHPRLGADADFDHQRDTVPVTGQKQLCVEKPLGPRLILENTSMLA
jgi:hypothetical protein